MSVEYSIKQIQEHLQKVRTEQGEQAYLDARRGIALSVILKENGEEFVKNAFPDLDPAELRNEAQKRLEAYPSPTPTSPEEMMLRMLQQQIPSIKTQAHFNLFTAAFDALRTCLDGYFSGDSSRAQKAREALNQTLDTAAKVKDVIEKLQEIPGDMRSKQATEYLKPPKELHEYDVQRQLLIELGAIQTKAELGAWYTRTAPERERVANQKLRNELIDSIRAKRLELEGKESN